MKFHVGVLVLVVLQLAVPSLASTCPSQCECSTWLEAFIACRGTPLHTVPVNTFEPALESLYFTYNKNMTVLRSNSFVGKNYSKLRTLILNNNFINTIEPNAFNGLISLKNLDLSDNEITSISPAVFPTLQGLTRLNLYNNRKLHLPDEGYFLPRLALLNLRACNLDTIPLNFFSNMRNLKTIKLDRNRFSYLDHNVFQPVIPKLKSLDLSVNKFIKLPEELLKYIPLNVDLHLEYNRYHCDCEFAYTYCLYERRKTRPPIVCATPKRLRNVIGSQVKKLLKCEENANSADNSFWSGSVTNCSIPRTFY